MRSKDQGRSPKDWKMVAAIGSASALGLTGFALAGDDESGTPSPIELRDRNSITEVTVAQTTSTTLADLLGVDVDSLDSASSPFDDDATGSGDAVTVASAASPVSAQSAVSVVSTASPASLASPVSADSGSADSAGSADNSADS